MEEFEFQYYAPNQYHHSLIQSSGSSSQQGQQQQQQQQFVQYQKGGDSRCSKPMVYSMDRLSPYYQDDSRSTNLSNLTLDQIFKSNQSDDPANIVVVNSNDSLLLFQQQQQQPQQANSNQQAPSSASPSNASMSSSSSPQSSSSPSSANDANSAYVEGMQLMECAMGQQQGQSQMQHHPTLVSLVPASASSLNPLLNPMIRLGSPSKPSTVSELSNSSMVSSSSSSTLDSSQFRTAATTSATRTRTRNANPKPISEQQKDGKYFERRKRNNVAAKKSRDARKQREDEIAIRASFLEKENSILKAQLQTLKDEAQQLRILLTQKKANQSMGALMPPSCASCSNCIGKQAGQAYLSNLNTINSGYESEAAINSMVDQKLPPAAAQQNATNANNLYLGQTSHGQQLNKFL